nr:hypothetical protein [Candidatus Rickettsia colombianensi]
MLKEDTALYGARVARAGIAMGGVAVEVVKGVKLVKLPLPMILLI